MKFSFLRILAAGSLLAGCTLATASSHAAEENVTEARPPGRRTDRTFARALELTPAQRDAVREIRRAHQPALQPLREQARAERAALRELVAAPTLNETAVAAQADRLAAVRKEIIMASARLRADLRNVLTPEQLAKWEDRLALEKTRPPSRRAQRRERDRRSLP